MPKTFPIRLEVEEIALGSVLRKLNDMPGIAKLDLDLGQGGQGAGKEQLAQAASVARSRDGGNKEQAVVTFLMDGPKHISEISAKLGGDKSRAYTACSALKKKGLVEPGVGKGTHQLTAMARKQLGGAAVPAAALPAPAAAADNLNRGPGGRASPGSGNIVLRAALDVGPMPPADLREKLESKGMSPKSISGIIDRAKKNGLIKKNGSGYELTAKGHKIELGATNNG